MEEMKEKLWSRPFLFSWFANFYAFTTMYYLLSGLPLYATQVLGGDKGDVGILFSLYAFAGVLARPAAGYLLDHAGRRRVAWVSLGLLFFAVLAYPWAAGLTLLFALRFGHGVFWGFATTSLATLATDVIPAKRRGEGIGWFGLSMSVAMLIGPGLGLALQQQLGYTGMFLGAAGLAALSFLCLLGIGTTEAPAPVQKKAAGFMDRKLLPYAGIVFFMAIGYSAVLSFVVLFAQEIQAANAGLFFLVNAAGVILSRPYAGKIMDRRGPAGIMWAGLAAFFAAFICLFFSYGTGMLLLAAFLLGIGFGILYSLCFVLAVNAVAVTQRGMANGAILTAFDLGFAVGAMALGEISMYTGLHGMYLLCAAVAVIPMVIFYRCPARAARAAAREGAIS